MEVVLGIILSILAYLLGTIPSGLLLTKYAGLGDIREIGSGNIGATNVLRTGNKKLAALTLLLDMLKGFIAVELALHFTTPAKNAMGDAIPSLICYLVATAVLAGHILPFWLKFKGGKGVATYFGILLALHPYVFLLTATNWLVMFYAKRISSLAALFAVIFVPFWMFVFTDYNGLIFGLIFSAIIAYTHRENIKRLINGTEPRFSADSTEKAE